MNYMNFLYVISMSVIIVIVLKGIYEIYWTDEKATLKQKPIIKYGLPILVFLVILPYLLRYLLNN